MPRLKLSCQPSLLSTITAALPESTSGRGYVFPSKSEAWRRKPDRKGTRAYTNCSSSFALGASIISHLANPHPYGNCMKTDATAEKNTHALQKFPRALLIRAAPTPCTQVLAVSE